MSIFNIALGLTTNIAKKSWQSNHRIININTHPEVPRTNLPGTDVLSFFSDDRYAYSMNIVSSDNNPSLQSNDSLLTRYDDYLDTYESINKAKSLQSFKN